MRLTQYTNESTGKTPLYEIIELIYTKCRPFIKDLAKGGKIDHLLYSGRKVDKDYFIGKVRTDRRPVDTSQEVHEFIDDAFNRKFGFRARSNALFCTGRVGMVYSYGRPYCIFPIGKYKILWSNDIKDLFISWDKFSKESGDFYEWIDNKVSESIRHLRKMAEIDWQTTYGEGGEGGWDYDSGDIEVIGIMAPNKKEAFNIAKESVKSERDGKSSKYYSIYGISGLDTDEIDDILKNMSMSDIKWRPDVDLEEFIDNFIYDTTQEWQNDPDLRQEWEENVLESWFDDIVDTYSNKDIREAIKSENEIMLNCKEYIAVKYDTYGEALLNYINKNGSDTPEEARVKAWYMKNHGRLPKQLTLF